MPPVIDEPKTASKGLLTLWADESYPNKVLEQELMEQGFEIDRRFSETSKPIVEVGGMSFVGYRDIHNNFLGERRRVG